MKLPAEGQEFAKWKISTTDVIETFEAQFTGDTTWYPLSLVDGRYQILLCGPDAVPTNGAIRIKRPARAGTDQKVYCRFRCVDTPERVIRPAGWIELIETRVD